MVGTEKHEKSITIIYVPRFDHRQKLVNNIIAHRYRLENIIRYQINSTETRRSWAVSTGKDLS